MEYDEFNKRIEEWVGSTRTRLKQQISTLSMKGKGALLRSLQGKTHQDYGEIDRISYTFLRHGVFFHKGVGRGYPMMGGRVVRGFKFDSRLARKRSGKPAYIILDREIKRHPKEWFNPVLDQEVPRLADLVAELKADMAVDSLKIKIR